MTQVGKAQAHANIALVKYWGKRDSALNLPARGSISLTLEALTTTAEVEFTGDADVLSINGKRESGPPLTRLSRWLDILRAQAGVSTFARITTHSSFPTASGLASSASAYAALAVAASHSLGMSLTNRELSVLARRGSGSAARSMFGGFVRWHRGTRDDGTDSVAEPIVGVDPAFIDSLRMVIAIVDGGKKKEHSSRDAMQHCAQTSALYSGWLQSVDPDIDAAMSAIASSDIRSLGEVAEASCLCMHASMWAARPAIMYWKPATLACIDTVRELRAGGIPCYFTIDAGPHVKVLTLAEHAETVASALGTVSDVSSVLTSRVGGDAKAVP